jgi:hypothetical protein
MLNGITNAIATEYFQRTNLSRDAAKFTGTVTQSGAASSAVADASKLGTNFNKANNEPKPKRSVEQVRASVSEAIDFLNTPEGKIISALG